jgi:RecA-family ATPase
MSVPLPLYSVSQSASLKIGKSTWGRQKVAAVAAGGELFDAKCSQAKCAFLSLEENDRQTRHKFELAGFPRAALANIDLFFSWGRGADGVLQLARLLDEDEAIKYVIIDSLTRFRAVPDQRQPAFSCDYEAVSALQALCKTRPGVTIEAIHHTRKAKGDDPLEDISGTYGLSAACDWYAVMRHHEDGAVLHMGGRLWDRDESQFQLRRAKQRWELVGAFSPLTQTQRETLDQLRLSGGQTPTEAAKFWGVHRQTMMDRFRSLVQHGAVHSKDGIYYAK